MKLGGGARLALSFFTVLPVGAVRAERSVAAPAMAFAPAVGVLLGAAAALVAVEAGSLGASPLLAGVLGIATLAALTRGLHLDGLADTADGLGCGGPPEQALDVMKRSDIGPFGVVVLVMALLVQVAALAGLVASGHAVSGLVIAAATGRAGVTISCRSGVPAARPGGLGALVAGSVSPYLAAGVVGLVLVAATFATTLDGGSPLRALVAVATGLGATFAVERHAVRRLGGITGDVFGALVETGTTVALAVLATVR